MWKPWQAARGTCGRAVMVLTLSLGGCVSHTWAPGPDVHATFEEQSAQCRIIARHGGSGFYASGSASYVAGVAIGNAIGNAVQANADFNDCMAANGWVTADHPSAAPPIAASIALTTPPPPPTAIPVGAAPVASMTPVSPLQAAAPPAIPLPAAAMTPCGEDRPCNVTDVSVGLR
jgi:hypothetical protein